MERDGLTVEIEPETDGRWVAEIADLSGALAYGETPEQAVSRVKALALRILADRLEHGESVPSLSALSGARA